ncbi:MAG: long-chain fatty acid--CoA ligase [Bacteroidales bacterium]|jgi:long-chain acyl-CoA synthetase|nr:long-chain fatty acid--CoA ligase [Bacteroidales bacterium]
MITRIFDILEQYRTTHRLNDALAIKTAAGKWTKYSGDEYLEYVTQISCGLLQLGFKRGDKIAMISNNRPAWNFFDMGMAQIGVVSVPIYPTISTVEYEHILTHAAPKMLILSDKLLLEKLRPLIEASTSIQHLYTFNQIEGEHNWKEIAMAGKDNAEKWMPQVQQIKDSIQPDDMFTIIYTSGTTGIPKGVMLSHNNLVTNVVNTSLRNYIPAGSRALSFLPISHIYERMMNYHFQYKGYSVYYAESLGAIMENIKEVKPHIFNTVPRLLERIYIGLVAKGKELKGIQKILFQNAIECAIKYNPRQKGSLWFRMQFWVAKKLIFPKWMDVLGGSVRIIVSGGAPLQTRLSHLFSAMGIDLLEGYGLTETSPVIAVSDLRKGLTKPGTVGHVLDGLDVKLADDGEILCKGYNIMLGYYNAPELTAQVIDQDGYFHTGDIGTFDSEGFLTITDRKKEIFKLSSGKYVTPQVIENKLKESFFVEQVIVIGENEKFASALIVPDFSQVHKWCFDKSVKFNNNNELLQREDVMEMFQQEVNQINKQLGNAEQIKRFRLIPDEWSSQTGELSPTLKLKRKFLLEKYAPLISEIYNKNE